MTHMHPCRWHTKPDDLCQQLRLHRQCGFDMTCCTCCFSCCRWHVKPDGHADPSVRTLMRPLLNLFHGEPGCKRWKNAVDELLRTGGNTITIREWLSHMCSRSSCGLPRWAAAAAMAQGVCNALSTFCCHACIYTTPKRLEQL